MMQPTATCTFFYFHTSLGQPPAPGIPEVSDILYMSTEKTKEQWKTLPPGVIYFVRFYSLFLILSSLQP